MDTRVRVDNIEKIKSFFDMIEVKRAVDKKKKQIIELILKEYTITPIINTPSTKSKELRQKIANQSVKLTRKWGAILSYMGDPEIKDKKPRLYNVINEVLARFIPDKVEMEYTGHLFSKSLGGYAKNYINEVYQSPLLLFAAPIAAPLGTIGAAINANSRCLLAEKDYVQFAQELTTVKDAKEEEQKELIALIMKNNMMPKLNQSEASKKLIEKLKACMMHTCNSNDEIIYTMADQIEGEPVDLKKMIEEIICYMWEQDDEGFFLNNGKDLCLEIITAKNDIATSLNF